MIAHLAFLCGLLLHGEVQLPNVPPDERQFESKTISVKWFPAGAALTDFLLTEHGDADYVIVEAFYWTDTVGGIKVGRIMLHKEVTTPLAKEFTWGVSVALPYKEIVFVRVKELKLQNENEFGDVPK